MISVCAIEYPIALKFKGMKKEMLDKISAAQSALGEIASDNRSGAAEILARAGTIFSLLRTTGTQQDARNAVIELCAGLIKAQPHMAPIVNLANAVTSVVINIPQSADALDLAEEAAKKFIEGASQAARLSSLVAAELIGDGSTVLTHSRSSTVLDAFLLAKGAGRHFDVIATESRPLMEGRALALSLARERVSVTLITDSASALLIDRADMVLVGADSLTPGFLTNKIGTRLIALAARERAVPVYAICDSSKFIASDSYLHEEPRDPSELWSNAPQEVRVVNRYFEPTPIACFTGVISEEGMLARDEVSKRAGDKFLRAELAARLQMPDGVK